MHPDATDPASALARAAVCAAEQALHTAHVAETAAVEAALLARVALDAARMAFDHAAATRPP